MSVRVLVLDASSGSSMIVPAVDYTLTIAAPAPAPCIARKMSIATCARARKDKSVSAEVGISKLVGGRTSLGANATPIDQIASHDIPIKNILQ